MSRRQAIKKRASDSNFWLIVLAALAYLALTGAYAWQTLDFVSWLFIGDIWFKVITMFSFDGCATGYAMFEMFFRFRLRKSKTIVLRMWYFTFGLATIASIVQLFLASRHLIPHTVDLWVVIVANALVIIAFVANIIAIVSVFRMEWNIRHPEPIYDDDEEEVEQEYEDDFSARIPANHPLPVLPAVSQNWAEIRQQEQEFAAFQQWKQLQPQSPLQQPQMKADQAGATNGQNGHAKTDA